MRQTGTLIKRYAGDEEAAKQYLGIARTLLGRMKATLAGAAGSRLWVFPNGTTVRTAAGPHGDIVEITAKAPAPALEEMLSGLVCIPMSDDAEDGWGTPEDDDHPIGTPGGPKPQFFLRANREGAFAPEFRVKRHTEFKAGNINWTNASHSRRLSFHGPRSRYFLDGYGDDDANNYAAVYSNGKEIDLSGFFNRVVGAAMRGNVLLVMVTDYAGKYRLGYKFPGEAFALAESYNPPSRAPNADYIPWTIAPFNQSATKCSFVMNTPALGGGRATTILVEGTIGVDLLTKEAHITFETSAPGLLSQVAQADVINQTLNDSGTLPGSVTRSFSTTNTTSLFIPEGGGLKTFLCVDYEGDTRLVGEVECVASASGGGAGGTSYTHSQTDTDEPPVRELIDSYSGGGSYTSHTAFEYKIYLCINGDRILLLEEFSQSSDVAGSSSGGGSTIFRQDESGEISTISVAATASHTIDYTIEYTLLRFSSAPGAGDGIAPSAWRLKYVDLRQQTVCMLRLFSRFSYSSEETMNISRYSYDVVDARSRVEDTVTSDHRFAREELFFNGVLTTLSEIELSNTTTPGHSETESIGHVGVYGQFGPLFFASGAIMPYPLNGGSAFIPWPTDAATDYERLQPGGNQDINPAMIIPSRGELQFQCVHAPVQRRIGARALFLSMRDELNGDAPRRFHNFLFLDGAERDAVAVFNVASANPRFADIASF